MITHSNSGYGGIYNKGKHQYLKYNFNLSETIETNFSQAYQDMYVLSMLNGKKMVFLLK